MSRAHPHHLAVGHLSKAHGTRGELYVWPLTDHPESAFAPGVVLSLGEAEDPEPSPDLPTLRVAAARPFREGFLVTFGGVEDRNQADLLRGKYVYRAFADVEPLAEGELFHHQLLGLEVVTRLGAPVGEVTEVYELQPAILLEVTGAGRQVLVPFVDHVVVEVDAAGGRLVIDPPEGLLDL